MATVNITGSITDVVGAAAAGARLTIQSVLPGWSNGAALILGEPFVVTADGSGDVDFDVEPGDYRVQFQLSTGEKSVGMSVGSDGPYDLAEVINATTAQALTTILQTVLGYKTDAENARDKAQDWAEGTLPGGPGTKSAREYSVLTGADAMATTADRAQTLLDRAAAAASATAASLSEQQSQAAAVLAGAPIAPAFPTDDTETAALPSPFLFIGPEGVQSWTHSGTFASLAQGLYVSRIEFDDEPALLAYNGPALPIDLLIRTRKEGLSYAVVSAGETHTAAGGLKLRILSSNKKAFGAYRNTRIGSGALVSFIFDDSYLSAYTDVAPLFEARGMTCGFAVNASLAETPSKVKIRNLLAMQAAGHEICNHGTTHTVLSAGTESAKLAENEIIGGYRKLTSWGFDVQTYVAAGSVVHDTWIPLIEQTHASGYTVGSVATGAAALTGDDAYRMSRLSLYSAGLANAKATVDAAIANNGYVCFYDHDPDQSQYPSSMSLADLEELLDYCVAQGVSVVNPRDAIDLISSSTLKSRKVEAISALVSEPIAGPNIIKDSVFARVSVNLSEVQRTAYDWAIQSVGAVTGAVTGTIKSAELNPQVSLSFDTAHTVTGGSVLFQGVNKLTTSISTYNKVGPITLSFDLSSPSANVNDNYEVTIGIAGRRRGLTSAMGDTWETAPLYLDQNLRRYAVTIAQESYGYEGDLLYWVRIKPKVAGQAAVIEISKPMINYGSTPLAWSPDVWGDWRPRNSSTVAFGSMTFPINAPTKLFLTAGGNVDDFAMNHVSHSIIPRFSGLYQINATMKVENGSIPSDLIGTISLRINGDTTEIHPTQSISTAGLIFLNFNYTTRLAAGDLATLWGKLASAASYAFTANDFSTVNVARVG